jgi:hypothetical protein
MKPGKKRASTVLAAGVMAASAIPAMEVSNQPQRIARIDSAGGYSSSARQTYSIENAGPERILITHAARLPTGLQTVIDAKIAIPSRFHVRGFAQPLLILGQVTEPYIYFVLERNAPPTPPTAPLYYLPDLENGPPRTIQHTDMPVNVENRLCRVAKGVWKLETVCSSPRRVEAFAVSSNTAYWVDPRPERITYRYVKGTQTSAVAEPASRLMATDLHTLKTHSFSTPVLAHAYLTLQGDVLAMKDGSLSVARHPVPGAVEPFTISNIDTAAQPEAAGHWVFWEKTINKVVRKPGLPPQVTDRTLQIVAARPDGSQRRVTASFHYDAMEITHQLIDYRGQAYAILSNTVPDHPGYYLYRLDPAHPAKTQRLTQLPGYFLMEKVSGSYLYYIAEDARDAPADGSAATGYARYRYRLPYL